MDPSTDRKNGNIFLWANLLTFFAAPVRYIGVTQAALCDKLGASHTVANLPMACYVFGAFGAMIATNVVPHRWERRAVVTTSWLATLLMLVVAGVLIGPFSNGLRIWVVVGQCLFLGVLSSTQQTFLLQCLGRGTTEQGRARGLQLGYSAGPLAAVAGSLTAQFILNHHVASLVFPRDFAALYLIGVPASAIMAMVCGNFELPPLADEAKPGFFVSLGESFGRFLKSRVLMMLWFGYFLWYCAFLALPNLTLYARHAMHRDPAEMSGLMMAIQFGTKGLAGFALGLLYKRKGVRAPLFATTAAFGIALVWAWTVPGYGYLAVFAFVGAGQLGGIYFPNAVLSWSPSATAARDLSILGLASVMASIAPPIYGQVTDRWGFPASLMLGFCIAMTGLMLVFGLPARAREKTAAA